MGIKHLFRSSIIILLLKCSFVCLSSKPCPSSKLLTPCKCDQMLNGLYVFRTLSCVNIKNFDFGQYFKKLEKILANEGDKSFFKIEIRHTDITQIEENIFSNIEFETVIINDNNYLTHIHPKAFINEAKDSIKYFYAQINNISSDNIFMALKHLRSAETIDLYGNSIENIPSNAFEGLTNLSKLSITRNKIKSIGENTFKDLESLNELSLNSNLLTQISKSILNFNKSVKSLRLFLNNNKLNDSSFNDYCFDNLGAKMEIHLESNGVKNLTERIFRPLIDRNNKTTIFLENNSIDCKQIKWITDNNSSLYSKAIHGIEC